MRECSSLEQLSSLPPSLPRPPAQKWDTTVLSSEWLCLQYNVAEGNRADTAGNLAVSEEAVLVAECLMPGCWIFL